MALNSNPPVRVVVADPDNAQLAMVLIGDTLLTNVLSAQWDVSIDSAHGVPVTVLRLVGVEWVTGQAARDLVGAPRTTDAPYRLIGPPECPQAANERSVTS